MADEQSTEQASQTGGLNFDLLTGLAQHAHTVLEGQELLKRLTSKELAPSFNDAWIWGAAAAQRKQDERQRLTQALHLMAADAVKSGNLELLPAFFRPLKEGESAQIMQAYANSPRGQLAQGIQSDLGAPVQQGTQEINQQIAQALQAENPEGGTINALPEQRTPTMNDQAARTPAILQKFLPLLALAQGKTGDILKVLQENRIEQARTTLQPLLEQAVQGQGPASPQGSVQGQAPSVPAQQPITSTPLPLTAPGAPVLTGDKMPIYSAIIEGARKRGIDPVTALSLFRQESNYTQHQGVGAAGERGIGQITTGLAQDRHLDQARLTSDVQYNIDSSLDYQADLQKKYGAQNPLSLQAYNGLGTAPGKRNYVNDVTRWNPQSQRILAAYDARQGVHAEAQTQGAQSQAIQPGTQAQAPQGQGLMAGPGAPTSQGAQDQGQALQTQGTQPFTLPPYNTFGRSSLVSGVTTSTTGVTSAQIKMTTPEEKAGAYAQYALNGGGWRAFKDSVNTINTEGHTPAPRLFMQLREGASNQAYWEARNQLKQAGVTEPTLDIQARQRASENLGALWAESGVGGMQNPIELKKAEITAGAQATTQALQGQEVREVVTRHGGHAFYTGADNQHDFLQRYPQTSKYSDFSADLQKGHAAEIDSKELGKVEVLSGVLDNLNRLTQKLNQVYGSGGLYEKMPGAFARVQAGVKGAVERATQNDVAYNAAVREYKQLITPIARTLGTESGRIPFNESRQFYAGAIPDIEGFMPDRPEVAAALVKDLGEALQQRIGIAINQPTFRIPSHMLTLPAFGGKQAAPTESSKRVK